MTRPNNGLSPDFRGLVCKSFDGPLTRQEEVELQQRLLESPAAREWYADAVSLHADLVSLNAGSKICKDAFEQLESTPSADPLSSTRPAEKVTRAVRSSGRSSLALARSFSLPFSAAALLIGVGLGCSLGLYLAVAMQPPQSFTTVQWDWKVDRDVVARTVSTSDAVLQTADVPETPPTHGLRIGQQVRLDSGLVQLRHRDGAVLILEGPATYEARSDRGGKLFVGKAKLTVPDRVGSFVLSTRGGEFRCGAGEFAIESSAEIDGGVHMQAYANGRSSQAATLFVGGTTQGYEIAFGQSVRIDLSSGAPIIERSQPREFVKRMPANRWAPFEGVAIPLGNLFDDSKDASISEAVLTDTFCAAAETVDLGVAAVHDGHLDTDLLIAEDGVAFNLNNVGGGGPRVKGLPANDSYRSTLQVPIRTTGRVFLEEELGEKCEEGVGMCANEMLTFDLEEIRKAGQLEGRLMTFVADKAGINDREPPVLPFDIASAQFVVIVSTNKEVLSGYVNGQAFPVMTTSDSVYQFDISGRKPPRVIRRDGTFVAFEVPIPCEARFLTLATCMYDVEHDDHAVFSGARLEIGGRISDFAVVDGGLNHVIGGDLLRRSKAELLPLGVVR